MSMVLEGKLPDGHLSFSRIKTFCWCPNKYYLNYVKRVQGLVGVPMLLGLNYHSGVEHGLKAIIAKGTPKTRDIVEKAVEGLKFDFETQQGIEFDEFDANPGTAVDDLARITDIGFKTIQKTFKPVHSERDFIFTLDSETKIHGRTDVEELTAEGVGITEMKTTRRAPRDVTLFDWQTSIYQHAKGSTVKWLKKFIIVRSMNSNRDITIMQFRKQKDSPAWTADILKSMRQIKEQIKSCSVFGYPKTPDLQICTWCQYRHGCRPELFSHESNIGKIIAKDILFSTNYKKQEAVKNGNQTADSNAGGLGEGQGHHRGRKTGALPRKSGSSLPNCF